MRFDLRNDPRLRYGVLAGVATLLLAGWFLMGSGSTGSDQPQSSQPAATPAPITRVFGPAIANAQTLKQTAENSGRPIFWLGKIEGTHIEITVNSAGAVYLRYLPLDVEPGSGDQYPLIATYPDARAVQNVSSVADGSEVSGTLADGTVYSGEGPKGVRMYQATPGTSVQVEVFSPTPGEAFDAVVAGRVVPVG